MLGSGSSPEGSSASAAGVGAAAASPAGGQVEPVPSRLRWVSAAGWWGQASTVVSSSGTSTRVRPGVVLSMRKKGSASKSVPTETQPARVRAAAAANAGRAARRPAGARRRQGR